MNFTTTTLGLFTFSILYLFLTVNTAPDETDDHNIKLIQEAFKIQEEYRERWNEFIRDGKIIVSETSLQVPKNKPPKIRFKYQINLELIGDARVSDIFKMLQSFAVWIAPLDKNVRFFEIPIGGEVHSFRLQRSQRGVKQISVKNEDGNDEIEYDKFLRKLANSGIDEKEVAAFMLEAIDSKLNDEEKTKEYWEKTYMFLQDDEIKSIIKQIIIVTQVAEAASPTTESFEQWEKHIHDIKKIVFETERQTWEDSVRRILKDMGIQSEEEFDFGYEELFSSVIQFIPGEDKKALTNTIAGILGNKIMEKIDNKDIFLNALMAAAQRVREAGLKVFVKQSRERKVTFTGRVPFADEVFKETLREFIKQDENSTVTLKAILEKRFPMHLKRDRRGKKVTGLIAGRYDIATNRVLKRKRQQEVNPPNKRRKMEKEEIDPVEEAREEHDSQAAKEQVEKSLDKGCDEKKRAVCNVTSTLVENSIKMMNDKIFFETTDVSNGVKTQHEVEIDFSKLSKPQYSMELIATLDEYLKLTSQESTIAFTANVPGNVLTCSEGNDFLQGKGGKDTYIINSKCKSATINNYDEHQNLDLLMFECLYEEVKVTKNKEHLMMECQGGTVMVTIQNWFYSKDYQHCQVKTSDKITASLPAGVEELAESAGRLFPIEIELDEDCNGESKHLDLRSLINRKVERFAAKTDSCSVDVTGNSHDNYIDPGPGNPYGIQNLQGGNGSDTYVIGHNYGPYNKINNYAEDNVLDNLMFDELFHDIQVAKENCDAILTSKSKDNSVRVTLSNYFQGESYQHILIHSADNFQFSPSDVEPYITMKVIDYTDSSLSQVIAVNDSITKVTGSMNAENSITSGKATVKVTGGNKHDKIIGSPMDEYLFGLEGNDEISGEDGSDYIFGGDGVDTLEGGGDDDVIYGGLGADRIDGGKGSDYVVFSGVNFTGVSVDLQFGYGWGSDAEGDTYTSIENILATEYDDALFGNDDDNFLNAYGGSDLIVPGGGRDVLQGGTGNDFYDLTDAYGRKTILNFATDELQDLILLNKTSSDSICYFYLDEDLDINIKFDTNTANAFKRVQSGQNFLHIELGYILRNTTYQHISFLFSDGLVQYPDGFDSKGKQLFDLYSQIMSGYIVDVSSDSHSSLQLSFNFTDISYNNPDTSTYKVEYAHVTYNSLKYYSLNWPTNGGVVKSELENVRSGIEHNFLVTLTSCELSVAISPLVSYFMPPSPPIYITSSDETFDGFTLSWVGPSVDTDPMVDEYSYIVKVTRVDTEERAIKVTVDELTYTTHNLVPETEYRVSIASVFQNIQGPKSSPIIVTTGRDQCDNLQNMPAALKIGSFTKIDGVLHANLYCMPRHVLKGQSQVACGTNTSLPQCDPIVCQIPTLSNAVIIEARPVQHGLDLDCSSMAFEDCTYIWQCDCEYENDNEQGQFSSTCTKSGWSPQLKSCVETPSCDSIKSPANGQVSSSSVLVNQRVSYSCFSGYTLNGPCESQCVRHSDNSASLSPANVPTCSPMECPQLLPQTNGKYSSSKQTFYTGDRVTLTCNNGYYIRNAVNSPHQDMLICKGEEWSVPQTHCKRIFEVVNVVEGVFTVSGTLQYSFSAWSDRPVDPALHGEACSLLDKHSTFLSILNKKITCKREYSLVKGPNKYTGFLQVSTNKGQQLVCTDSDELAKTVCDKLGYSQYSSSVAKSEVQSTQLTVISQMDSQWLLEEKKQSCTSAISCRGSCPELNLLDGNDCQQTLEGQTCHFSCKAGYLRTGSSQRTCTGSGSWTGHHTYCDGKNCMHHHFSLYDYYYNVL